MFERKVIEYLQTQKHKMLQDLELVVNIHSGTFMSHGTSKVSALFAEMLDDIGAEVDFCRSDRFGNHMIARIGPGGGEKVFVVGHVDTVFEEGENWGYSVGGGLAFGPGVTDMKSGVLVFIWALRAMKQIDVLNKEYVILLNTDEEPGSPESRGFIEAASKGCDYALVMEPAEPGGEILHGRKGVGIFGFVVRGIAAHAGQDPAMGASAIRAAAAIITDILNTSSTELGTSVNVGTVSGGTAAYTVPAYCRLEVDVRVATYTEMQRIEKGFTEIAKRHSKDGINIEFDGQFHRPPMIPNAATRILVQRYQAAAEKVGFVVTSVVSGAASDGNTLADLGFPVLDGLGAIGGRIHSSEEYMDVQSYFDRTAILAIMLAERFTIM